MKICIKCSNEKTGSHYSYCKECNVVRVLEWRKLNKEKYNETQRKYTNSEKPRDRSWEKNNKEKVKEQKKAWALKNKKHINEQARLSDRKRRVQKQNNGFSKYSEQEVLIIYGIDCYLCNVSIDLNAPRQVGKPGWEKGLHIDHLVPISKGGPDTLENFRPAHGLCNLRKSQKLI